MIDYSNSIYNAARRQGYLVLAETNPYEFEISLVGVWVAKYKNYIKPLKILAEIVGKNIVEWSDLTERTLKRFKEKVLENNCKNSARTIFARLKSVLNDMKNEVDIPCENYEKILACKKEPSQHIYLTERELEKLDSYAPINPEERYVKSICLIGAYTGCRHSDAIRLSADNIDESTNTISYVSQKCHIEAVIPVHRNLRKYLDAYDKDIEMQDYIFNDIIRSICKKIGIKERIKVYAKGREIASEKWELIASHDFRRTFATILYQKGCDLLSISRMMGHNDIQMTRRYICGYKDISKSAMSFFN